MKNKIPIIFSLFSCLFLTFILFATSTSAQCPINDPDCDDKTPDTEDVSDKDKDGYNITKDCNDNDATIHEEKLFYLDEDADNVGSGDGEYFCQNTAPTGYSNISGDNCPSNANSDQKDLDKDGYGNVCDSDKDGDGYKGKKDCDDEKADIHTEKKYYADEDNDEYGYGSAFSFCLNQAPEGYAGNNSDNCPTISNKDQLDTDSDKIGDACDEEAPEIKEETVEIITYYFDVTDSTIFQNIVPLENVGRITTGQNIWNIKGWLTDNNRDLEEVSLYCENGDNLGIACGDFDYQVYADKDSNLIGYAWSDKLNDYLRFDDDNPSDEFPYGVKIDKSTNPMKLTGKAWSDNYGYIDFDNIYLVTELELAPISGPADLVVSKITIDGTNLFITMKNEGATNVDSDTNGHTKVYLDGEEWMDLQWVDMEDKIFLLAGGGTVTTSSISLEGKYILKVCVDDPNIVTEANENNNCLTESFGKDAYDKDGDGISDNEEGCVDPQKYMYIKYDYCPENYICSEGACVSEVIDNADVNEEAKKKVNLSVIDTGIDPQNSDKFFVDICTEEEGIEKVTYDFNVNGKSSDFKYNDLTANTCVRSYTKPFSHYDINSEQMDCYDAKVDLDPENKINESTKEDNVLTKKICFGQDLYIGDVGRDTIQEDAYYADVCSVNQSISEFKINFTANGKDKDNNYDGEIPANECVRIYSQALKSFKIDVNEADNYEVTVTVDSNNKIKEANEENNIFIRPALEEKSGTIGFYLNKLNEVTHFLKADSTSSCIDSDGVNKNTAGYTQGNWYSNGDNATHSDFCSGLYGVYESYCDSGKGNLQLLYCNEGEVCKNGACEPSSSDSYIACTETDNGYDIYNAGSNTGIYYIGGEEKELTDSCNASDGKLKEVYCSSFGTEDLEKIDTDNDGLANCEDLDSDDDNIIDEIETNVDEDKDGIPNYMDSDSDNDGSSDKTEAGDDDPYTAPADSDNNGTPDYLDKNSKTDIYVYAMITPNPGNIDSQHIVYAGSKGYKINLIIFGADQNEVNVTDFNIEANSNLVSNQIDNNGSSYQQLINLKKDDSQENTWYLSSLAPINKNISEHCGQNIDYYYEIKSATANVNGNQYEVYFSNNDLFLEFENPIQVTSLQINDAPYFTVKTGESQTINALVDLNTAILNTAEINYQLSAELDGSGTLDFKFINPQSGKNISIPYTEDTTNTDLEIKAEITGLPEGEPEPEIINELLNSSAKYTINGIDIFTCQLSLPKSTQADENIITNYNVNISGVVAGSNYDKVINIGADSAQSFANLQRNINKFLDNKSSIVDGEKITVSNNNIKIATISEELGTEIYTYITNGGNIYINENIIGKQMVLIAKQDLSGNNGNIYIGNNVQYVMDGILIAEGGIYRYDQESEDLPHDIPDRSKFLVRDQFLLKGAIISKNNILKQREYKDLTKHEKNLDVRGLSDFGCVAENADETGNPSGADITDCPADDLEFSGNKIDFATYKLKEYPENQPEYVYPIFIMYSTVKSVLFK